MIEKRGKIFEGEKKEMANRPEELPVDPKVETGWKLIEMIARGQINVNGG
ncbi:hypothetical protein [Desulfurobacterium sp.]|nr:hypothetical protein [Desulfurobacterium sp.]